MRARGYVGALGGHASAVEVTLGITRERTRSRVRTRGHACVFRAMWARSRSHGRSLREDWGPVGAFCSPSASGTRRHVCQSLFSASRRGGRSGRISEGAVGGEGHFVLLRVFLETPREQDVSRLESCLPAPRPGHGVASLAFPRPRLCQTEHRCHLRPLLVSTGTSVISERRWSAPRMPARMVLDSAGSLLSCVGPVGAPWCVQHRRGPAGRTADGAAAAWLVARRRPEAGMGGLREALCLGARGGSCAGSGPVSEAHLPMRRCIGPAVSRLAAAALARGLQPQDWGDCCGHLCFHPPSRSHDVQHFPSLQDWWFLLGEILCLVLTSKALWKVLERACWLWMRNAESQGTRDCDCVSECAYVPV